MELETSIDDYCQILCEGYLLARRQPLQGTDLSDAPTSKSIAHESLNLLWREIDDSLTAAELKTLEIRPDVLRKKIHQVIAGTIKTNTSVRRHLMGDSKHPLASKPDQIRVFVSYRRCCSLDFVRHIVERLNRDRRFVAVFDHTVVRAGDFPIHLGGSIKQSDVLVLVIRPETLKKIQDKENWIRRELITALHFQKQVLPVLVDADGVFDKIDWPRGLDSLETQHAIAFKREYFDVSLDVLTNSIIELKYRALR